MNNKSNAGRKKLSEDKLLSKKILIAFTEKEFEDLKLRTTIEDGRLKAESSQKKKNKFLQPFEYLKMAYRKATDNGMFQICIDEVGLCSNAEISNLNAAGRMLNQSIRQINEDGINIYNSIEFLEAIDKVKSALIEIDSYISKNKNNNNGQMQ
jgi:hypothetical protein